MALNHITLLKASVTACLAFVIYTGCEKSSSVKDSDTFSIRPASTTLSQNNRSVILKTEGGNPPFTWVLSDETLGSLSGDGNTVTYTRNDSVGANTIKATDERAWTASAVVIQDAILPTLTLSPASASVSTNGGTQVFLAAGGSGTYTWRFAASPSAGTLSHTTGPSTVYTSTGGGSDVLEVNDGQTHALATITKK